MTENEFPCRVAAAIDPYLKTLITQEAIRRHITESTLVREILTIYFAFFALKQGNRVYTPEKEDDRP